MYTKLKNENQPGKTGNKKMSNFKLPGACMCAGKFIAFR